MVDDALREKTNYILFCFFSFVTKGKFPLFIVSAVQSNNAIKKTSKYVEEIKGLCSHWKIKIVFFFFLLFNNKISEFSALAELFCGINKEAELLLK